MVNFCSKSVLRKAVRRPPSLCSGATGKVGAHDFTGGTGLRPVVPGVAPETDGRGATQTRRHNPFRICLQKETKATKNLRYLRDLLFKESAIKSVVLFIIMQPQCNPNPDRTACDEIRRDAEFDTRDACATQSVVSGP